jgi:hypothetical protein
MTYAPAEEIGGGGPKVFGLPVEPGLMFSNHKGIFKSRIEKRQRKLIVKLGFLKPFLAPGEKMLLVTTCYSPLGTLGQYLTGFLFVYLKRSLLVFTNRRILHVPTTPVYDYRRSLAQIAYEGCSAINLKGGVLNILYARFNRAEYFRNVAISERRKIRALLQAHISPGGLKTGASSRLFLCPQCTLPLLPETCRCEHCRLKFKSKFKAILMAILVPGGGYFYVRHYLIGLLSAVVEIFLLAFFGVSLKDMLQGLSGSLPYTAALGAIYLAVKIITVIHSTEFVSEYIPAARKIEVKPQSIAERKAHGA